MCAISGIVAKDSKRFRRELALMVESLDHRGPDGNGTFFFKNCAISNNRLAIVDLSTGDQPMLSPKKNTGLVFNGEIYGYQEIKDKLRGYKFTTTSDTEVVLALYEKYGYQMAEKLPGMFALAIWDEKKDELICFRDRFGEKPFYYARGKNGEFIFASEIKAILKTGLVRPIIDPASLSHYLQYLYVPKDKSIYSNIHVLPPAHGLVFSKGKLKIWKYWAPGKITQQYNLDEAAEHFEILFRQAVSRQLIADVPVGALLSGGLDSSSVIAIASQQKANLSTFSFGFEGGRNELSYAREAAKKYKTNHHEFYEKDIQPAEYHIHQLHTNPRLATLQEV
jgi:asparagine synthase (glutamine-hydrolysing)